MEKEPKKIPDIRENFAYCIVEGKENQPCDFRVEGLSSLQAARDRLEEHEKEAHKGRQVGTFGWKRKEQ